MSHPPSPRPVGGRPTAGPSGRGAIRKRLLCGGALVLVLAGLLYGYSRWSDRGSPPPPADPFPLTPLSESPYLNTRADARYIGSDACRDCHEDRHVSFRHTGMGRSMGLVDPTREPPDAAFDHPASKRRYQVVRRDGQLWHRELLLTTGPDEVLLSEYPVKYVVGSGRHSLTYLVETDGFLVESPVTWYTAKKAWGMSPGYDNAVQHGFELPIGEGCLVCHAGQSRAVERSLHRMVVDEPAIGCERCHGPGSLHAAKNAGRADMDAGPGRATDFTIVNPSRLSRELGEAVCQQCHLRSDATIPARGRALTDFRPGLPLQDFRADYRAVTDGSPMTVVGHVEQMHLSKCYQKSDSLTCLTCHSPHAEPRPEDRVAHYKAACATCHQPQQCKVSDERRKRESPDNNCVQCHMPISPTEIPHLAFTHHRIGKHDRPAPPLSEARKRPATALAPFLDDSRLGETDRKRSLGLGYLEAANRGRGADFQREALSLLLSVRDAGLEDSGTETAIARVRFDFGFADALKFADAALSHPDSSGQDRCNALLIRAEALSRDDQNAEALTALKELTRLRRHPTDWWLRAKCEHALGNTAAEYEALETATRIDPRRWEDHRYLADRYREQGNAEKAEFHNKRALP